MFTGPAQAVDKVRDAQVLHRLGVRAVDAFAARPESLIARCDIYRASRTGLVRYLPGHAVNFTGKVKLAT